jgi:hypothetical protein
MLPQCYVNVKGTARTDPGPDRGRPLGMPPDRDGFIGIIDPPPQARPVDKLIEIGLLHLGHMLVANLRQRVVCGAAGNRTRFSTWANAF